MKKLILLILVCSLLLLTVTSCLQNNKNEQTTPQDITESTTPVITTQEIELKPAPETPIPTGFIDESSDLIVNLLTYLEQYGVQYSIMDVSFSDKINGIKNVAQPIHVAFSPSDYYFVCGYYNVPNEHDEYLYCCAPEYTWVGYKSENEIQEYLNEMRCVVVFQMNKAITVTNLLDPNAASLNMEHFQMYKPEFENGINVSAPAVFDKTFIFLDEFPYVIGNTSSRFKDDMMYHSTEWYYHENESISCVELDGKYYLSLYLYNINAGGSLSRPNGLDNDYFKNKFEAYYDVIVSVIDIEKHNVIDNNGRTTVYGVISIEDFVNEIVKR